MTTIEEWTAIHADLMRKLRLPCGLVFSTDVRIAQHRFDEGTCCITINPEVDFKVPEHVILHEAAHHRNTAHFILEDVYDEERWCCTGWTGGHCKHWARVLCGIYAETEIALPYSTSFKLFAAMAGIKHKMIERHGKVLVPDTARTLVSDAAAEDGNA